MRLTKKEMSCILITQRVLGVNAETDRLYNKLARKYIKGKQDLINIECKLIKRIVKELLKS